MPTMKEIELFKPHTHDGRDYPEGAVLMMDKDNADWLIAIGAAKETKAKKEPQ